MRKLLGMHSWVVELKKEELGSVATNLGKNEFAKSNSGFARTTAFTGKVLPCGGANGRSVQSLW